MVGLGELRAKLMNEEEGVVSKSRILEDKVMNEGCIAHDGRKRLYRKELGASLQHSRQQSQASTCITLRSIKQDLQSTLFCSVCYAIMSTESIILVCVMLE